MYESGGQVAGAERERGSEYGGGGSGQFHDHVIRDVSRWCTHFLTGIPHGDCWPAPPGTGQPGDLAVAEAQSTGLGGVVGEQALAAADHDGSIMSRISSIR